MLFSILIFILVSSIITVETFTHIDFESPDITAKYFSNNKWLYIDAYKSKRNDELLEQEIYSNLRWYSLGDPSLVPISSLNEKIFLFGPKTFDAHLEMLTDEHKELFVQEVKKIHDVEVEPKQIEHLILSEFICEFDFYDENGEKSLVRGEVSSFKTYPLRLQFNYPDTLKNKTEFNEFVSKNEQNLKLKCEFAKIIKSFSGTLTISTG